MNTYTKKLFSVFLLVSCWSGVYAGADEDILEPKEEKKNPFKIDFHGYIRLDAFTDTRKSVDWWRGIDYSYPLNRELDPSKRDINIHPQFTAVPYVMLRANIEGPEVWGAKSSAVVRTDNAGKAGIYGLYRMQHGYFQLDWEKTSMMVGRYYQPLTQLPFSADTVSINAGEMFDPFQYSTQVKVSHKSDNLEFIGAIDKLYELQDRRDSVSPGFLGQVNYYFDTHVVGAGAYFHTMQPRLETDKDLALNLYTTDAAHGYKENAVIPTIMAFFVSKFQKHNWKWVSRVTYAENGRDFDLLGGYAVCQRNPQTDERKYCRTRAVSFWSDMININEKREIALFLAFAKNLGSRYKLVNKVAMVSTLTVNGANVDTIKTIETLDGQYFIESYKAADLGYLLRIQPRVRFFRGPVTFGLELEHTLAQYGTINEYGKPVVDCGTTCSRPVSNTRLLASVSYGW